MVLLEGKFLLQLLVLLIANTTTILAIPLESQVFPNCSGCQTRDSSGICQKTNTVLKDDKCYYLDLTKPPFDAGPKAPPFPYPCTGCQKKDSREICQSTFTVLAKDMKCYYRDLSMEPFRKDTIEFKKDLQICTGCQKEDMQGKCQNTSTILKDGKCYFIDFSNLYFYALPKSQACPGCQRRDENRICQISDTVLTGDGMCYYIDPGYGHYDSLPYPTVCPECQKFDFTGICVDTTAILKDGKCYYLDSKKAPFDMGRITPADTPITATPDRLLDSPDCPGCQLRDLKGICQATATVLIDGQCYYVTHFDDDPPSPN